MSCMLHGPMGQGSDLGMTHPHARPQIHICHTFLTLGLTSKFHFHFLSDSEVEHREDLVGSSSSGWIISVHSRCTLGKGR